MTERKQRLLTAIGYVPDEQIIPDTVRTASDSVKSERDEYLKNQKEQTAKQNSRNERHP